MELDYYPYTYNDTEEGSYPTGGDDDLTVHCVETAHIAIPVIFFITAAVGLCANMAVIYLIIILREYLKTVTNIYVLQLAIADFMFLFVLPFEAASLLSNRWTYGVAWCKITESIRLLNFYASILFLTMMSVDRYMAINHPMSEKVAKYRSKVSVMIISISIWLLGFVSIIYILVKANVANCLCSIEFGDTSTLSNVVFPPDYLDVILTLNAEEFTDYIHRLPGHCSYKGNSELSAWLTTNFVVAFVVPLLVICWCYSLIIFKIYKPSSIDTKSHSSNKTRKRITYMVCALVVVFIVCWLPYYTFNLSRVNNSQLNKYVCDAINSFTRVFAYLNSALNPFFYLFMGTNIKKRWINAFNRTWVFRSRLSSRGDYSQGNNKRRRRKSSRMSMTGNFKPPEDDSMSHSMVTKHTVVSSHSNNGQLKIEEDQV